MMLGRLGISSLNPMQEEALESIKENADTLILSPTGSGKTLAYLLPLIEQLKPSNGTIQAVVVVPARELALQISQVFSALGSEFRAALSYGGRPFDKEHRSLVTAPPDVLIGTPGRIVDHIENKSIDLSKCFCLVLDEFDKSLEFGFSEEMKFIIEQLPNVRKRILLSATEAVEIPDYVRVSEPHRVNYLSEGVKGLELMEVVSDEKDKLPVLKRLLCHLGTGKSIVFCNFRESAERIGGYLKEQGIQCVTFHGGMEQSDREKAICLFRNDSVNVLVSTDLAARGLDIPEVNHIIHYHLPATEDVFTHRNGRTARMNADGTALVILYLEEKRPDYLPKMLKYKLPCGDLPLPAPALWSSIYVGKGKRDKISKGDVVGFMFQKGGLEKDELGMVEVKERYAIAAVKTSKLNSVLKKIYGQKIKGQKTVFELIELP